MNCANNFVRACVFRLSNPGVSQPSGLTAGCIPFLHPSALFRVQTDVLFSLCIQPSLCSAGHIQNVYWQYAESMRSSMHSVCFDNWYRAKEFTCTKDNLSSAGSWCANLVHIVLQRQLHLCVILLTRVLLCCWSDCKNVLRAKPSLPQPPPQPDWSRGPDNGRWNKPGVSLGASRTSRSTWCLFLKGQGTHSRRLSRLTENLEPFHFICKGNKGLIWKLVRLVFNRREF